MAATTENLMGVPFAEEHTILTSDTKREIDVIVPVTYGCLDLWDWVSRLGTAGFTLLAAGSNTGHLQNLWPQTAYAFRVMETSDGTRLFTLASWVEGQVECWHAETRAGQEEIMTDQLRKAGVVSEDEGVDFKDVEFCEAFNQTTPLSEEDKHDGPFATLRRYRDKPLDEEVFDAFSRDSFGPFKGRHITRDLTWSGPSEALARVLIETGWTLTCDGPLKADRRLEADGIIRDEHLTLHQGQEMRYQCATFPR